MRIIILSAAMFIPSSAYAQEADVPNLFGQRGYVTRDELAKLTFGTAARDLSLCTHIPTPRVPAGSPLWSYFIVKNLAKERRGIDMRFDFVLGNRHASINSCSFNVKPLTLGAKLGAVIQSHCWECGSGSLVDVEANGYYVAGIDLMSCYKLEPGDYEVSWRHSGIESNPARFTVLGPAKDPATPTQGNWAAWKLEVSNFRGKSIGPLNLRPWYGSDLSAALGSGVGDRYITNLEQLSAADDSIQVTAEWKLGKQNDQVTLKLESLDPKMRVGFKDINLYLLATTSVAKGDAPGFVSQTLKLETPLTLDLTFSSNWRIRQEDVQMKEGLRAAFLISTKPLRAPTRNNVRVETLELVERRGGAQPDRIWDGMLRTTIQELSWR